MQIPITDLRQKIISTLRKNLSQEQAAQLADQLLWADMCGIKTHGTAKLTGTEPLQNVQPMHEVRIERDTKLSQLINAGGLPAPLVAQQATDIVIQKAKDHGFAIVGVHNTYTSTGAQAYFAEQIAKKDLIGIVLARSPGAVAPFNSIDPLFGTNPLAFSFPTSGQPLVFDMATSAMTWAGLLLAKARGEQIPEDKAIDGNGTPTVDPAEAMKGALLPFDGGHKGSGLSMVVEILAGPLAGSAYCDCKTFDKEWGSTFMAIDPNLLVDVDRFKANCSDLLQTVRSSRTKAGSGAIRLPGERAHTSYKEAERTGLVDVEESVLRELGYIS